MRSCRRRGLIGESQPPPHPTPYMPAKPARVIVAVNHLAPADGGGFRPVFGAEIERPMVGDGLYAPAGPDSGAGREMAD